MALEKRLEIVIDSIFSRLDNRDYVVSGTLVGSFRKKNKKLKKLNDLDIVIIVDELSPTKFFELKKDFLEIKEIFTDDELNLTLENRFGPLKTEDIDRERFNLILHQMIYSTAKHKKHAKKSPLTVFDWQLSSRYIKKPMKETYEVDSINFDDLLHKRRNIDSCINSLYKDKLEVREYKIEGKKMKMKKSEVELDQLQQLNLIYHNCKFSALNFLKAYRGENLELSYSEVLEGLDEIIGLENYFDFLNQVKKMKESIMDLQQPQHSLKYYRRNSLDFLKYLKKKAREVQNANKQ